MRSMHNFGRSGPKTDGAAIPASGGLPVYGFADGEHSFLAVVKTPAFRIDFPGLMAEGAQNGVIELLGFLDIVGTEHDMAEH